MMGVSAKSMPRNDKDRLPAKIELLENFPHGYDTTTKLPNLKIATKSK
jgi:hypothetical protein